MLKNTPDNANERWKDPAAWSCLDGKQRKVINDWYRSICTENEEKQKNANKLNTRASMFALTPFVFVYALKRATSLGSFLLDLISAVLVYFLIFDIFNEAYIRLVATEDNKSARIIKEIVAILVSFLLTNLVLHCCGII
ncbi:MAG: hypothetical protein IKM36_04865 [Oscillospiraceae bacterium]|nr:hypothetical protein [Oscillospiraceae bacterium]MBR3849809.1 hypothetical protein [Oscillospiraceae bacterium]